MKANIKCIFCLNERPGSEEHIFPDSIGGSLIINNVCKVCNEQIGRNVDSHLVNHLLMQFARLTKKIKGKTGKIPNPLGKGFLKGENDVELHYRFDEGGNPNSLYVVPKQKELEDGKVLQFSLDISDQDKLASIVNKTLKRRGLEAMDLEEIEKNIQHNLIENPCMEMNKEIDISKYRKALLKIVYEMAYYWIGEEYLLDPASGIIREYILSDNIEVENLHGFAEIVDKNKGSRTGINKEDCHIALLTIKDNYINCYINIFNDFEAQLCVSENSLQYSNLEEMYLEYNVKNNDLLEVALNDIEIE